MFNLKFNRVPGITKYLSLILFFAFIGRSTVWNFLPVYFENNIDSVFLVGLLTSLPGLVTIFMDIPIGNLVQRAGERSVIYLGFISGIFPSLFLLTGLAPFFFASKFMEGVGKSLIWNGGWSLALRSSGTDVESESVSVFLFGKNLSLVIGPVIGGLLLMNYGFNILFLIWFTAWIFSSLLFYTYIGFRGEGEALTEGFKDLERRDTYREEWYDLKQNWSSLRKPFSLTFLYSIIFSFYWVAIPLILDRMNADYMLMGAVFGFAALPSTFQFLFGNLADKYGDKKIIALMALLLAPTLLFMSLTDELVVIAALFFLARLFTSGIVPAVHSRFDSSVSDDIEGEMTGFNELAKHGGQTAGPLLAGSIASLFSVNASFVFAAGISMILLIVTLSDF